MHNNPATANIMFDLLEGTWQGEGRGGYPTIDSFDYLEKLIFTRKNGSTLAYDQRTEKRMEGSEEFVPSHWENGFISILENGDLELVNAQSGGRGEVLSGRIEALDSMFHLHFVSKALMNDARMVSSTRLFELEGDQLRYEMEMSTTKVDRLTLHLANTLNRIVGKTLSFTQRIKIRDEEYFSSLISYFEALRNGFALNANYSIMLPILVSRFRAFHARPRSHLD